MCEDADRQQDLYPGVEMPLHRGIDRHMCPPPSSSHLPVTPVVAARALQLPIGSVPSETGQARFQLRQTSLRILFRNPAASHGAAHAPDQEDP